VLGLSRDGKANKGRFLRNEMPPARRAGGIAKRSGAGGSEQAPVGSGQAGGAITSVRGKIPNELIRLLFALLLLLQVSLYQCVRDDLAIGGSWNRRKERLARAVR
jgi:hypothetical protein